MSGSRAWGGLNTCNHCNPFWSAPVIRAFKYKCMMSRATKNEADRRGNRTLDLWLTWSLLYHWAIRQRHPPLLGSEMNACVFAMRAIVCCAKMCLQLTEERATLGNLDIDSVHTGAGPEHTGTFSVLVQLVHFERLTSDNFSLRFNKMGVGAVHEKKKRLPFVCMFFWLLISFQCTFHIF